MTYVWPLLTLWIVHLMAVMSPGQSFIVVSRTALGSGRAAGIAAALGMGAGILPWAIGALLGLAVLFARLPLLYATLKVLGGLYLIYVAIQIWRHAGDRVAAGDGAAMVTPATAFRRGFWTQIANPKVAMFYGSIFVAILPPSPPLWLVAVIFAILLVNEIGWFAIVATFFSAEKPRQAYFSVKPVIDRVMAGVLGLLGAKLIEAAMGDIAKGA